ncbi:1ea4aa62-0928-4c64-80f3-3fe67cb5cd55 [Thermothielavioides terrestris]|uniref:Uncharacterized protein n=2 Tax=Thermothielavioides terrestris TaxID=2587410 RepID=G2QZX0_THETT|nr:uncharacterized protein THITE_2112633 [Thermothielavioides terrestris NRRL 8126]AEO65541.1 hypothetical protein THITE_2112633 [Thermothielavioides terrestris NRRL 8126]SPQ19206.1 1ea4aa62-0928-4c64-80f3-3fe67cb5cd55 [Thermothielavioides terrestris]
MAPFIHDDEQKFFLPTREAQRTGGHGAENRADPDMLLGTDSRAAMLDRAEDISVALEWKLLLPLLARGVKDPRPSDRRQVLEAQDENDVQACMEQAYGSIAQAIRKAGETAVTMHSLLKDNLEEKDFWASGWVVKKANSAEPLEEEKSFSGYVWVPVEICSPKMRFQDPETQARMQRVMDVLNSSHRLAANCTCEVHIHLGRMDGRPWSLPTLKRLGTLLWLAEPTLRSIRDPRSPNFHNVYTWGFAMRRHSRLARRVGELATLPSDEQGTIPETHVLDALQGPMAVPAEERMALIEIWKTASHLELGQLLSGPAKKTRRLGFNFSAFGEEDERARRNPRTVEFRMMDGSVRADLILGWLAICGSIAQSAVSTSDGRFAAAIRTSLRQRIDEATIRDTRETVGHRRGREFRELMQALGVAAEHYRGLEEKVTREHCLHLCA